MEDCWDDDEFRPLWDEDAALTGLELMRLAEGEPNEETRRSLERASVKSFWKSLGKGVSSYGGAGARTVSCAPCPVCRRDYRR